MIEMTIDSIRVSLMNYQRVVILKEKETCPACHSQDMEKIETRNRPVQWKCNGCGKVTDEVEIVCRYLPIWIGPAEADAIAIKLQRVDAPRPMTHDLLLNVLNTLQASMSSILIHDLKNDTFYAKIFLDVDGSQVEIDSRPSDALALAVRGDEIPIFASESVLNNAGILLDGETGKQIFDERDESTGKPVTDEEMKKKLPNFYDFINTLDLDDFDKRKS